MSGGAIEVPSLGRSVSPGVTPPPDGTAVTLGLRPEHVTLDPSGATHGVDLTEALGGVSYACLRGTSGERMIVEERGDARSNEADTVGLSFNDGRVYVFDKAS